MIKGSSLYKRGLAVFFSQLALCLYTVGSILGYSPLRIEDIPVFGIFFAENYLTIVLALLFIAILSKSEVTTPSTALFMLVILAVMLIVRIKNYAGTLAVIVLFMVAVSGTDPKPYLRSSMWASLIVLLLLTVCTYMAFINEVWVVPNGIFVSGHGVNHPNTFACIIFNIEAAAAILCKNKRWKVALGFIALFTSYFAIRVLSSRTGCAVHVLLGIACFVEVFLPQITSVFENPRFFVFSLSGIVLGLAALICILIVIYTPDNPVLERIGSMLPGRIRLAHEYLQEGGGLSLFGQKVIDGVLPETARLTAKSTQLLDSTYGHLVVIYGLAGTIAFTALFIRANSALCVHDDKFMIWTVIVIFAIYGVMESSVAHLAYNCTFALLASGFSPAGSFSRVGLCKVGD